MSQLTAGQIYDLFETIQDRKRLFPNESEFTTFSVVLLNWGDSRTEVSCIAGEWRGTKAELPPQWGLPHCPNGHPLIESGPLHRLGLVEVSR